MTSIDHTEDSTGWAAEQLTAFLAAISTLDDRNAAMHCAVERAAEAVDAEIAAVVTDTTVVAGVGFPRGQTPHPFLRELALSTETEADIPGLGPCRTLSTAFAAIDGAHLLVARAGPEPFTAIDRNLLRSMCTVLALSLRGLETIGSLRERQSLLERLTRIQRSISLRAPLDEVLTAIVTGASELLGDEIVGLRRVDPDDPTQMQLLCSTGLGEPYVQLMQRSSVGQGAGGIAVSEDRVVTFDQYADNAAALPEFIALGMQAAMAAPVHEDGRPIGSLVIATRRPGRVYTRAEQDVLTAFASHASMALTDARTVQALRDALVSARHDAFHDVLTGLPNRALLRDRLEQALRRAQRRRTKVAVLFLDLDGFKRVNDSLGHDAGDELLLGVAGRLQACIRDIDTLARLGGDEFAFLLEDLVDEGPAYEIAERVHTALDGAFDVGFREIHLTASIGIAFADSVEDGARELLRNADVAMYQAKAAGKRRHVRFDTQMYDEIIQRLEFEGALRTALDNGEFFLEYQPIVDLHAGRTTHVEALARWRHPRRGVVSPSQFIPVAEGTGVIVPLGEWILARACEQAQRWQRPGRQVAISVNLSPGQIASDLPQRVSRILAASGLAPYLLTLEITEGLLVDTSDDVLDILRRLQALGVQLAIDDFGTGYSSLSRLRDLPVDQLKIDRSFVRAVTEAKNGTALVSGVINIAQGLGLSVVAEGVETHEQRQVLQRIGCRLAQGYLFGMPVDAEVIASDLGCPRPIGAAGPPIPRARAGDRDEVPAPQH